MSALDRLRQFARQVADLGPHGAWFAAAVDARINGNARSLDQAMGLSLRGGLSIAQAARKKRRNAYLRQYVATFLADLTPDQQARELASAISRFATCVWPRYSVYEVVPAAIDGTPNGVLFNAFKAAGDKVPPSTPRHLKRILAENSEG